MLKLLLIDLGDVRGELNEPLGLECISSRVIREGIIEVDMCWYNMIDSESDFLDNMLQYDIIGISINIGSLGRFESIYRFLMKSGKNKFPLILGGCIPTFAYEQLIDKYENIICIYGEGEEAFFELIHRYVNGLIDIDERLLEIGNLAFRFNNKRVVTPGKPLDLKLENAIVRDKTFLEYIKKNHGIVRLEGSRGCSWNRCSFCCVNAKYADSAWRDFPIDKIVNELIEISNMGFHAPYFTDEDFFGHRYDRAIELGKRIIELKSQGKIRRNMNFYISIMAADAICEEGQKALTVWKEAGLREVFLGIESLEKDQLKRYHKKADIDTNKKAIAAINKLELQLDSGYILFDPEISFEALGNSLDYINDLRLNQLDSRSLKRLRIQPFTSVYKSLSNVITGDLDINNLEYPYKFIDDNVNWVFKEYKKWEDENLEETWKIQSASRGEISEDFREKLKSILGSIRDIDFGVLKYIYNYRKDNMLNLCNFKLTENQIKQKEELINKALGLMDDYIF